MRYSDCRETIREEGTPEVLKWWLQEDSATYNKADDAERQRMTTRRLTFGNEAESAGQRQRAAILREIAVRIGHLTPEQQAQALADNNKFVRTAAVERGGLTPEQLENALVDESRYVRRAAVCLGGLSSDQISRAIVDNDYHVRWAAIEAGPIRDMDLGYLCGDPQWQIRVAAIEHAAETGKLTDKIIHNRFYDVHPRVKAAIRKALADNPLPGYLVVDELAADTPAP